jgi:hypothetical protein
LSKKDGKTVCGAPCGEGKTCSKTWTTEPKGCNIISHFATAVHGLDKESDECRRTIHAHIRAVNDALQQQLQQKSIEHMFAQAKPSAAPSKSAKVDVIRLFAETTLPFSFIENEHFRRVLGHIRENVPLERKGLAKAVFAWSHVRRAEALKRFKGEKVTIALDSGTIWRRYLAVMVISARYPPLLLDLRVDTELNCEGRLTAATISRVIALCVRRMESEGAQVVAVVADNASNMQSAMRNLDASLREMEVIVPGDDVDAGLEEPPAPQPPRVPPLALDLVDELLRAAEDEEKNPQNAKRNRMSDEDDDDAAVEAEAVDVGEDEPDQLDVNLGKYFLRNSSGPPILIVRCKAHSIQLAMRQFLEHNDEIEENAQVAAAQVKIDGSLCKTRWNAVVRLIDAALAKKDAITSFDLKDQLEKYSRVLKPFKKATDMVQQNHATLWHAALAVEIMLEGSKPEAGALQASAREAMNARAKFLISPGLLLLAYLAPNAQGIVDGLPHGSRIALAALHTQALPSRYASESNEESHRVEAGQIAFIDYLKGMREVARPGTEQLVSRLLIAGPTEAAVERLFSGLKNAITRHRTRLNKHATCQTFCKNFGQVIEANRQLDPTGTVKLGTWRWILEEGCRALAPREPVRAVARPQHAAPAAAAPAVAQAGVRRERQEEE